MSSGWLSVPGSPPLVPRTSWPVEQALGPQEPDGQLRLVAGRPHRDRDRDRVLARAGGPDLERLLADDAVVADLERLAADRHDPAARHVPDGRDRVAGQAGHVVPSSAATERLERRASRSAAATASPRAGEAAETATRRRSSR